MRNAGYPNQVLKRVIHEYLSFVGARTWCVPDVEVHESPYDARGVLMMEKREMFTDATILRIHCSVVLALLEEQAMPADTVVELMGQCNFTIPGVARMLNIKHRTVRRWRNRGAHAEHTVQTLRSLFAYHVFAGTLRASVVSVATFDPRWDTQTMRGYADQICADVIRVTGYPVATLFHGVPDASHG